MGGRSVEIGKFRKRILPAAMLVAGSFGIPTSVATGIDASVRAEKSLIAASASDNHNHYDSHTTGIAMGFAGTAVSEIAIGTGIFIIYRRRRSSTSGNPPAGGV